MSLSLNLDLQNNGNDLIQYGLEISIDSINFINLTHYDGISPACQIGLIADNLITG